MSTFTTNLDLELVARGGDVGVWDTPTNANWSLIDLAIGGSATQALNNANIILSAAQFQSAVLMFTSTLTGSVTITFPSTFTKTYKIYNATTSATQNLTVTLGTTASGAKSICAPPGEIVTVWNDGTNLRFMDLERVGTVVDFATATVPPWITGCTVPPYLTCDGTAFSSATYGALFNMIGAGVTPDLRGRSRAMLNQGTARITSAVSGIDGNSLFSVGGDQNLQSHSHNVAGTTGQESVQHVHVTAVPVANTTTGGGAFPCAGPLSTPVNTGAESVSHTHAMNFASGSAGAGGSQNMPPACIVGISMIRAG